MRTLAVLTSAAVLASLTTAVTALPAAAADDFVPSKTLTRSSWGYTDLGTPNNGHANPDSDAFIGTWTDRRWHRTRSYFTFDVAEFRGKNVLTAAVAAKETEADDCSRRAVELWRTEPYRGQSWLRQPKELELLGSAGKPATGCLVENVSFDVSASIKAAVARGDKTFTVALRVPAKFEHDPRYHRHFANDVKLAVTYNTPPSTPTALTTTGALGCDTTAPGKRLNPIALNDVSSVIPQANFADADAGDKISARFAVWPVASPADRRELVAEVHEGRAYTYLRNNELNEVTYAWQVRGEDGTDVSAWSQTCYFTVDRTPPAKPGAVGDVYYQSEFGYKGAPGTPGTFTFDVNGSDDVVEFEYTVSPYGAADPKRVPVGPDGKATVTWTPTAASNHYLYVTSIDKVGMRSQTGGYSFYVRENRPDVWSNVYPRGEYATPEGGVGRPGVFTFTPGIPNVVEYTYRLNDGATQTVPAGADGKASVTLAPTAGGWNTLFVANKSASGELSIPHEYRFRVDDTPTVTHDGGDVIAIGTDVNLSFSPKAAGVTAYEWQVGWGGEFTRIAADAEGKASVTWRALTTGHSSVRVRSISGDAAPTLERQVSLWVDSAEPTVERTGAEKAGETGQLAFGTIMRNPVSYTYWTDEDATRRTVPADAGRASVPWTPVLSGDHFVWVFATNAAGVNTGTRAHNLLVENKPVITSEFYGQNDRGRYPGKITFTAQQPNVKEFVYSLNYGPQVVVPAGPDGKAEFVWTPPRESESYQWVVFSRDTEGRSSRNEYHSFSVYSHPRITSTDFPEYDTGGAVGVEGTFTFHPNSFDVESYEYTISNWDEEFRGTVTAAADDTGVLRWTPTTSGYHDISVRHRSSDGQTSLTRYYTFFVAGPEDE
ncbi:hypothetical protein JNUCC0626_38785 [Lentzea sp. JNUCC 0626]|uniref:hypothetical protein n=1 Tax=Lentzea sp. JNUCC 0626 TaxID=3367513 RepID=UPI003749A665